VGNLDAEGYGRAIPCLLLAMAGKGANPVSLQSGEQHGKRLLDLLGILALESESFLEMSYHWISSHKCLGLPKSMNRWPF
jgi:hypothetical protein